MPDVSKINFNGTENAVKDSTARSTLATLSTTVSTLSSNVTNLQNAEQIIITALGALRDVLSTQGNVSAVAILDQAILDLSTLA